MTTHSRWIFYRTRHTHIVFHCWLYKTGSVSSGVPNWLGLVLNQADFTVPEPRKMVLPSTMLWLFMLSALYQALCANGRGCPSQMAFAIGTFTNLPLKPSIAGKGVTLARLYGNSLEITSVLPDHLVGANPTYIASSSFSGLYLCNNVLPNGTVSLIKPSQRFPFVSVHTTTMPGQRPAHVSVVRRGKQEILIVANVNGGTVKTFLRTLSGLRGLSTFTVPPKLASSLRYPSLSTRQLEPHPHMVLPYRRGTIVPDLGSDLVFYLSIDQHGKLTEKERIKFRPGDGPRHAVSHRSGTVFVVNELSNTVVTLRDDGRGKLKIAARKNLLAPGIVSDGTAAAIRLSNDNRYLYVSLRLDSRTVRKIGAIVVFKIGRRGDILGKVGQWSSHGVHPRDFYIINSVYVNGQCRSYVAVANRDTDNVVFIRRWPTTGTLGRPEFSLFVKSPASILPVDVSFGPRWKRYPR